MCSEVFREFFYNQTADFSSLTHDFPCYLSPHCLVFSELSTILVNFLLIFCLRGNHVYFHIFICLFDMMLFLSHMVTAKKGCDECVCVCVFLSSIAMGFISLVLLPYFFD